MKIFDVAQVSMNDILKREEQDTRDVENLVFEILQNVRNYGDKAVKEYTAKFDGANLESLQVSQQEIDEAVSNVPASFLKTLELAKINLNKFHEKQKREGFVLDGQNGESIGQIITPIEKVGIYVPGGTASYPSTVLMNAIPAKIAGVKEIVMVSPASSSGKIADVILAAAKIAGVTKIFKIGGAQAIGALAYGTESVPKVDKIVGPGNIFVATAKKQVFGIVNIDMIAGPSEILVVADEFANEKFLASDLLSQAEHDKRASAILITPSMELAKKVSCEVEKQLKELPREDIARVSVETNGKIIVSKDLNEAIEIANEIAPEHLELSVEKPFELLAKVKNAGSVFLGTYAPEALGDYFAGPNHTLPTNGTAKFSSPLSVDDFVKKTQFIYYTKKALELVKDNVVEFAESEGLCGHARSISKRFETEN